MYAPGQLTVVFLLSTIIRDKLDQPQIVSPAAGRPVQADESRSDRTTMNNISETQYIQRRRQQQQHLHSVLSLVISK